MNPLVRGGPFWTPITPPRGAFFHAESQSAGAIAVLLLDGAGWHSSPRLRLPDNIVLLPLPPYAPELNPVENVWQFLRGNLLSHRVWDTYEAILEACCHAWNQLIAAPERIAARWSAEVDATKTMLERAETRFHLRPKRIAADSAYGSGLMIGWLMQREIEPLVPLLDHEHQTNGFFTRVDFIFDADSNEFICPGGKHLRNTGLVRPDGTMPYHASTKDCRACSLKARCTKGEKRIVTRNLFEAEREQVRALMGTEAFERSAQERKKIEMRFAHLKRRLGFRRLRLRGITGASDEFLLMAIVQNLTRLVRFITRAPPTHSVCIT